MGRVSKKCVINGCKIGDAALTAILKSQAKTLLSVKQILSKQVTLDSLVWRSGTGTHGFDPRKQVQSFPKILLQPLRPTVPTLPTLPTDLLQLGLVRLLVGNGALLAATHWTTGSHPAATGTAPSW